MPITLCRRATPFSCSNGLFAKISGKASFCFCFLSNFPGLYSPWGSKNGINSKNLWKQRSMRYVHQNWWAQPLQFHCFPLSDHSLPACILPSSFLCVQLTYNNNHTAITKQFCIRFSNFYIFASCPKPHACSVLKTCP